MKRTVLFCSMILVLCLPFFACLSPYSGPEEGEVNTITISIGGGNARTAFPPGFDPTFLEHTIRVVDSGGGPTQVEQNYIYGDPPVTFQVAAWPVTVYVEAYIYDGTDPYLVALGHAVASSPVANVSIAMQPPVTITGNRWEGQVLSAASPPPVYGGTAPVLQWRRIMLDTDIIGATGLNYTTVAADWNEIISLQISFNIDGNVFQYESVAGIIARPVTDLTTDLSGAAAGRHFILTNASHSEIIAPVLGNATFEGVLDGNGNTVNLNIAAPAANVGLFYQIGPSGTVKNLRLTGTINIPDSAGPMRAGAVAGRNGGSIRNIASSVNITVSPNGSSYIGGIAGENFGSSGTIENSYATGDVSLVRAGVDVAMFIGGIAGNISGGSIRHCWAAGDVEIDIFTNSTRAGGIVGVVPASILVENCVALNGKVSRTHEQGPWDVGGRVLGGDASIGINNYGLTTMLVLEYGDSGSITVTVTPDINGRHGGNVTPLQAGDINWWRNTAGWTIHPTKAAAAAAAATAAVAMGDSPWWWDNSRPRLWFE
jgi:hypothetical protein